MEWSKIDPQDTNVIMHIYRGEVQRINTWRQRMDRTTNWAIVITVGVITFALSNVEVPHWALFPGLFMTYVLLFTEARRYRHYDAWRGRVRAFEEIFLAKFFDRDLSVSDEWTRILADDFKNPKYKIGWHEAVRARLLRIYLWIIIIFMGTWLGKVYLHPDRVDNLGEFFGRISGPLSVKMGVLFFFLVMLIVVGSTIYFILAPEERVAKHTGEKDIDHEFVTEEYIEEFTRKKDEDKQ